MGISVNEKERQTDPGKKPHLGRLCMRSRGREEDRRNPEGRKYAKVLWRWEDKYLWKGAHLVHGMTNVQCLLMLSKAD